MILDKLKEIFARINPEICVEKIDESTDLSLDLGLDSVSMLMLAYEIETEFGFYFETTASFQTVNDVCEYIEKRIN